MIGEEGERMKSKVGKDLGKAGGGRPVTSDQALSRKVYTRKS
jgi:hypothetical protein